MPVEPAAGKLLAGLTPHTRSGIRNSCVQNADQLGHRKFRSKRAGRPRVDGELVALIHQAAIETPSWGAPRIHGELLKLGYGIRDIEPRWKVRKHRPPQVGVHEITPIKTVPRSLWQNGIAKIWLLSAPQEHLNHVVVFDERQLCQLLSSYDSHDNEGRCHVTLVKDPPRTRPVPDRTAHGKVVSFSCMGGLSHRYQWREAA